MKTEYNAKKIVLDFIAALNEEDFTTAKSLLDKGFTFKGPLAVRNGADEYMNDMEKMKIKYKIDKTFVTGTHVCLIYNVELGGKAMLTCGLYHTDNNKIKSLVVIFDPRPALEPQ